MTLEHTILVVDDNPINLKLLYVLLSKEGFSVATAAHAEEALEQIGHCKPDLILMDVQLPGTDGLALTRMLKAQGNTNDIVIVALTSYAMKGDREKALAAGCDGYIAKPVDTRSIAATVRSYLQGA